MKKKITQFEKYYISILKEQNLQLDQIREEICNLGKIRELSETHENIVNLHIQIKYYADAEAGSMLKQAVMNIST